MLEVPAAWTLHSDELSPEIVRPFFPIASLSGQLTTAAETKWEQAPFHLYWPYSQVTLTLGKEFTVLAFTEAIGLAPWDTRDTLKAY